MAGRANWPQWTLRDLLIAPAVMASVLVSLQGEPQRVAGMAAAGVGLSLALAAAAMLVGRAIGSGQSGLSLSRASTPKAAPKDSVSAAGDALPRLAISRRKALAAIALAAVIFPLWMAIENELWRSSVAGGWLLPPAVLLVLLGLMLLGRWRASLHSPG